MHLRLQHSLQSAFASAPHAPAQQWPDKPVRILVPFPPGGGTDIQARLLSTAFQKSMGQNFLIDNRTGASGLIATQLAVDSPPDGNTILFTSASISVVATLYAKRMKFDVHKDLAPVSWISSTPLVLSLHPSVPAKSVKELLALAKRSLRKTERGRQLRGQHRPPHRRDAQPDARHQVHHTFLPRRRAGGDRADLGRDRLHLRHRAFHHAAPQGRARQRRSRSPRPSAPRRCPTCRR